MDLVREAPQAWPELLLLPLLFSDKVLGLVASSERPTASTGGSRLHQRALWAFASVGTEFIVCRCGTHARTVGCRACTDVGSHSCHEGGLGLAKLRVVY